MPRIIWIVNQISTAIPNLLVNFPKRTPRKDHNPIVIPTPSHIGIDIPVRSNHVNGASVPKLNNTIKEPKPYQYIAMIWIDATAPESIPYLNHRGQARIFSIFL